VITWKKTKDKKKVIICKDGTYTGFTPKQFSELELVVKDIAQGTTEFYQDDLRKSK